jgi:PAS domain S-box-containing protein
MKLVASNNNEENINSNPNTFADNQYGAGVWEYNFATGVTRWTDEVFTIYNLPLDCNPDIEFLLQHYTAESKVLFKQAVHLAITKGNPWDLELEFVPDTGKHIWIRDIGEPIFDIGHILMLKGRVHCITEKKNNENCLQIINNLLNIADEAIFICETSGSIIYTNVRATEMYGLAKNEIQNLKFQDIDDLFDDEEKWKKFISEIKHNGRYNREIEFRNFEGKRIPVNERAQYIKMSGSNYVAIFLEDISDKKSQEQKLYRNIEEQRILSEISLILNSSNNFEFNIYEALRVANNYCKISRTCVFEDLLSGRAVSNTFEYCNDNIESQKDNLQAIPYSMFPSWKELMLKDGKIEIAELKMMPQDISSIFKNHGVNSMLAFPLIIDEKYSGFITFIESIKNKEWTNDLEFYRSVSAIISKAFEHKAILDALRKSESRFREFSNLIPEIVFEMNINGKVTFANNLAYEKFNISDSAIKNGVVFYGLFIEEERMRIWEDFENIIKGKKPTKENYKVQYGNGTIGNVVVYSDLIMNEQLPIGMRAVLIDSSREENQDLPAIIKFPDEDPNPVLRVHLDGTISYNNSKSKYIRSFIIDNYKTYFKEIFNAIYIKGKTEELEINIAGEFYYLHLTPITGQNFIHIYARNITKSKLEDERSRLALLRFLDFSKIIKEFVWESDLNLKLKFVSEKVKDVLGHDASYFLGKSVLSFIYNEKANQLENEIFENIKIGFPNKTIEYLATALDGTSILLQFTLAPVNDYNRKLIGIRGAVLDISYKLEK